jgi:hypothetical protein
MFATHGLAYRFSPEANRMAAFGSVKSYESGMRVGKCFITSANNANQYDRESCLPQDSTGRSILLMGDSHAADLWPGLSKFYSDQNLLEAAVSGCRPLLSAMDVGPLRCTQMYQFIFREFLPYHPVNTVLLSGFWEDQDLDSLGKTIFWLQQHGMEVVLAGPAPALDLSLPRLLATHSRDGEPWIDMHAHELPRLRKLDETMSRMAGTTWHVRYISVYQSLCAGACQPFIAQKIPLLFDDNHLSPLASETLFARLRRNHLL